MMARMVQVVEQVLMQTPTPPPVPDIPPIPDFVIAQGNQPPEWVPYITIAFFLMIVIIAIGVPLARAFARRMDRRGQAPQIPVDVTARLERIEQAVESLSIEVERISEGQRFLTKVMTEMRSLPSPDPLERAQPIALRATEEPR